MKTVMGISGVILWTLGMAGTITMGFHAEALSDVPELKFWNMLLLCLLFILCGSALVKMGRNRKQ